MEIQGYPVICTGLFHNNRALERCRDCPMFDRRFPKGPSWRISGVNLCVANFLFDNIILHKS